MDAAAAGQFWFDPATMMQRRPSRGVTDALVRGAELNHERAHWHQFAGSTIGSLLSTLHRAEHFLLYAFTRPEAPAHRPFREAVEHRQIVGNISSVAKHGSLEALGNLLAFTRAVRYELLRSESAPDKGWEQRWLATQAIAALTYQAHTGQPSGAVALARKLDAESLGSLIRTQRGEPTILSTANVMEAGARLSEWTQFLTAGWGLSTPGSGYTGLSDHFLPYLADRLRFDSDLYRRCFDAALIVWDEPACLGAPRKAAEAIGRRLPMLVCCIDIALNPRVQPISAPEDRDASYALPGLRFVRAAQAIADVGPLEEWPSEETYASYRSRVLRSAGLKLGWLASRSFQHERFDAEFWTEAEMDDELLHQASYFDYLVWAMEQMHMFRRDRPLQWALAGLQRQRQGPNGADVQSLIDPALVWLHAPLYWTGDEWGAEVRMSEAVAYCLVADVASCALTKQAASGKGVLSLERVVPRELACDSSFLDLALARAVKVTGWDELNQWQLETPDESEEEPNGGADADSGATALSLPDLRLRVEIDRVDVEREDLTKLAAAFEELRRSPLENRWTCDLAFHSYDGDPRELFDISEVTNYLRKFAYIFPDWSWYLGPPSPTQRGRAGFTLCALAQLDDPRTAPPEEWQALAYRVIGGFNFVMDELEDVDAIADWEVAGEVIRTALQTIWGLRLD
jgi:hypothetical protein